MMRRAFWTVVGLAWFLPGNLLRLLGASVMGAAIVVGGAVVWVLFDRGNPEVAAFDLAVFGLALFAGSLMHSVSLSIGACIRRRRRGAT